MAPAMPKSATEVMQEILFATVVDAMGALRDSAGGLPNRMIGALGAIHANTAHADLPKELQDAMAESTRSAFTQLLKEGYAVGPRQQMQQSRPLDRVPERQRPNDRRGPPRGPTQGHRRGGRPPKGGGGGGGEPGGGGKPRP